MRGSPILKGVPKSYVVRAPEQYSDQDKKHWTDGYISGLGGEALSRYSNHFVPFSRRQQINRLRRAGYNAGVNYRIQHDNK